jgi:hypothetical protein
MEKTMSCDSPVRWIAPTAVSFRFSQSELFAFGMAAAELDVQKVDRWCGESQSPTMNTDP